MKNKLLLRQIKKTLGDTELIPESFYPFLNVVSECYEQFEKDNRRLERALEQSSIEMNELRGELRKESENNNEAVYEILKESLEILNEREIGFSDTSQQKLLQIAKLLKEETQKRKLVEKKLEENKAFLLASQRVAHVGSWELDMTVPAPGDIYSNTLTWSDETYRIFGFEPGSVQVSSDLFFDMAHPDDRQLIKDAVNKALEKKEVYSVEHRIILRNGEEKTVHERSEITYDVNTGLPVKMIGTVQDITNKIAAERRLKKAHDELSTLFNNMQEVYYSVDMVSYQLIRISKACENVYGYNANDFFQNSNLWFDVIYEEDKQTIKDNDALMYAGKSFSHEYRIRHKDGSKRWVESKLKPTLENGKLIRLDGITSDITKRKEAEIALRDSEHKFRSLIENSSDCITVINEKEETIFASNSIYTVTGFTPEETAGRSSLTFVHPDDLNVLQEHFKKVYQNPGKPLPVIYRRLTKDGRYIWCEGIATNLLNDPAVMGIVINFRDITERKKAEKALTDSEYRFRTLLEHSSDFITVINEKQETLFASDTLYRITGYKPEEVVNKPGLLFIHYDDQQKVYDDLKQLIENPGKPMTLTYRIIKKDGSPIWVERIATNLLHDPAIGGIVSNYRDISAHKGYEAALVTYNEDLKKTNMELDKFVYSASHDLRSPLASMAGMLDLLRFDVSEPEALEKIGFIEGSIKKLDSFIQDILDYSRNARLDIKNEKIKFNELLTDISDNLKYMGAGKGNNNVEIKINSYGDTTFYSDRHRISVILSNLISNAIRYKKRDIPDPYVEITVDTSDKEAILTIADNGIGIDKNNHEKIFEMFYRLSKNSIGSGLGLYIVKEAIEKLNGTIVVDSEPEKGSKFTVKLPNNKK